MQENVFEKLLSQILLEYSDRYGTVPDDTKYIFTNDMQAEYHKYRPDLAIKEPEKFATLNKYNGLMVPPLSVDGTFVVLINLPLLLQYDNMTWVGTIAHETTHVIDYRAFAALIHASDFEDITSIDKHLPFQLWTESNARARGYYFVRRYTFDDISDISQVPDILNTELPWQAEFVNKQVASTTDGAMQTYFLSHFIGRLYALNQIFPTVFTLDWVKSYFGEATWLYEWFCFFCEHQTIESAYRDSESFKRILRKHYIDLK